MPSRPVLAFVPLLLVACGGSDPADSVDAPSPVAACTGGDRFVLAGAFTLQTPSAGPITVDDKVVGIAGAMPGGDSISFSVRRPFVDHIDSVGDHDISTIHVKHLRHPQGTDCTTSTDCTGFFALAGTLTVLESSPRFRATFELSDLYEHTDPSDNVGAAIPGTITGCLDVTR